MTSRVRRCGGCGGPLSEAADERGTITCAFCGMVNEVTVAAPQPIVIQVDTRRRIVRPGGGLALTISLAIIVMLAGIGFVTYQAIKPATNMIEIVSKEALRAREATRPLSLTDLPTLKERGHRRVNIQPPPGGWTSFDAVAGVPWAFEIARAWTPDARLTRIDLGLIAGDGSADLTGDRQDTVGYRFVSPARIAEWAKIADSDVNAAPAYELFIRLGRSDVVVYVHSGRPPDEPPPPAFDGLPLRSLLTKAREQKRFPSHPAYTGFLIHSERMGWIWIFQSLSRRDNIPQVRARDGAVYPWR